MNKFNRGIFALLDGIGLSAFSMQKLAQASVASQPLQFGNRKQQRNKHQKITLHGSDGPNPAGTKIARKAAKGSLGIAVIR